MKAIFDIGLDSDIDLPELRDIATAKVTIKIRKGSLHTNSHNSIVWKHNWYDPDGEICISMGYFGGGFILRFPNLADFIISLSQLSIRYISDKDLPSATLRHLLIDQVIPRILGQQGRLVIHASAVAFNNEKITVSFLGDSGWGKSTIASSFIEDGGTLLTDDCLLLERDENDFVCIPNYYGARLFDDSRKALLNQYDSVKVAHYSRKKRLLLQNFEVNLQARFALTRLFLLNNPEKEAEHKQIQIRPISGADDFVRIIGQVFLLDPLCPETYKQQFCNIGKLMSADIQVNHLKYPRRYQSLNEVKRHILK